MSLAIFILAACTLTSAIPFESPVNSRYFYRPVGDGPALRPQNTEIDISVLGEYGEPRQPPYFNSQMNDPVEAFQRFPEESYPVFKELLEEDTKAKVLKKSEDHPKEKKISRIPLYKTPIVPTFSPSDVHYAEGGSKPPSKNENQKIKDQNKNKINPVPNTPMTSLEKEEKSPESLLPVPRIRNAGVFPFDTESIVINSKFPRYFQDAFHPLSPFADAYEYPLQRSPKSEVDKKLPNPSYNYQAPPVEEDTRYDSLTGFRGGPPVFPLSRLEKHVIQPINPSASQSLPNRVHTTTRTTEAKTPTSTITTTTTTTTTTKAA